MCNMQTSLCYSVHNKHIWLRKLCLVMKYLYANSNVGPYHRWVKCN